MTNLKCDCDRDLMIRTRNGDNPFNRAREGSPAPNTRWTFFANILTIILMAAMITNISADDLVLPMIPIWGLCQNWTKLQGGRPPLWQPLWQRLFLSFKKRKSELSCLIFLCWTSCCHHLLTSKGEDERSTAQGRRSAASQFRFVLKTTGKGSACQWGIKWVFGRH